MSALIIIYFSQRRALIKTEIESPLSTGHFQYIIPAAPEQGGEALASNSAAGPHAAGDEHSGGYLSSLSLTAGRCWRGADRQNFLPGRSSQDPAGNRRSLIDPTRSVWVDGRQTEPGGLAPRSGTMGDGALTHCLWQPNWWEDGFWGLRELTSKRLLMWEAHRCEKHLICCRQTCAINLL